MTFLRLSWVLAMGLLATLGHAGPPAVPWERLAPHPRLFASAARWQALRAQVVSDPVSQRLFEVLRERAEHTLAAPSLDLPAKDIYLHGPMRQIQGRIATLALVYRVTGDARYRERAKRELAELAATPHWRPGHFLSCAEATTAMAIGYDWLYDELSEEERTACVRAIVDKAFAPSFAAEAANESWLTSGGNWGPVCHGGLALGALAIAEREPELARRIVARSVAGVARAAGKYAPAGAHSEGPGYWAYGTNFYLLLTDALRTSVGTTCGLETAPGLLQTGDYNLQLTTPTGRMFSYGDSVPDFGFEPAMFWFAREHRRFYFAAPTLERLEEMRPILRSDAPQPDASRLQAIALLWWDPELRPDDRRGIGPLVWWSGGGPQPQAVMRSAWGDPRAAYLGIKAGDAHEAHAHMDAGSFLYEADGVRWAVDLGRDFYHLPRRQGLADDLFRPAQDSKRWSIFRVGAEAHNILRFNGAVPIVDGFTTLRPAKTTDGGPAFVAELSPAYTDQVARAARGFRLRPDRSIVIHDEWRTGDRAVVTAWQWLTFAEVVLEPRGATLRQQGETLRLRVLSPEDAHLAVEDWSRAPNAWDSPNPGLRRLVIRVGTAARSDRRLVVVALPEGANVPADFASPPLAEW